MSVDAKLRVLCYDVSCNRRRRRIAAALEDHATRVQESVFEARLGARLVDSIMRKVSGLMADSDSFRVYTIGKSGERDCQVFGQGIPIEREASYWLV